MTLKTPPKHKALAVKHGLREAWLQAALQDHLRPLFSGLNYTVPDNVRIGVGWPSRGGLAKKKRVLGQAWSNSCSKDETHEVIVSIYLEDAVRVLDVLIHELIHVTVGTQAGHKGPFREAMKRIGLEGKATATVAGKELAATLEGIVKVLGPYPHASLDGLDLKKQTTRMLLLECSCGLKIRSTQKWIDEYGPEWPCPCGGKLIHGDGDPEESDE